MRVCVADASVIAKWLLSDEEHCSRALDLKTDLTEGVTVVAVPALLEYELASLLTTAVRRGRILSTDAAKGLQSVFDLGLMLCSERESTIRALTLAVHSNGSVYDCAYLATAMGLGCDLYTADSRFIGLASHLYGRLRHIREYPRRVSRR